VGLEQRPARGERPLGLGQGRDGVLYVPPSLQPGTPAPLVVLLHGAGGDARGVLGLLREAADAHGWLLLVPESRGATWDAIRRGGWGPDVAFLDAALARLFARHAVDPARVAVAGFSDGASYALSLGLRNPGLFRRVAAFSPGFFDAPPGRTPGAGGPGGGPALFVSHGTGDEVLPIDATSRRLVPRLERAGYEVRYREFDGPHTVPPAIISEAVTWLQGPPPAPR
jgi:predicted esterase